VNIGSIVVYHRLVDLLHAPPRGEDLGLIVLGDQIEPAALVRTLRWLARQYPLATLAVLADTGSGACEVAARLGGAVFLTRPYQQPDWSDLLGHTVGRNSNRPRAVTN
jgi:hypothetical protein